MLENLITEEYDKVLIERFIDEVERYQSNHYGSYNRNRLSKAYHGLPDYFKQSIMPKKVSNLYRGADGVSGDYGAISFTDNRNNAFFYGIYAIPFHELQSYDGLIDTHKIVQFITKYKIQSDVSDDENEVIVINPVWKENIEDRLENYHEQNFKESLSEAADTESIYSKYFSDVNKVDFIKLVQADPTSVVAGNGYDIQKVGRYVKWLAKIYKNDDFRMEDLYKATKYLQIFDKYKQKLNVKDIFRFASLQDLYTEIEPIMKQLLTNKPVTQGEKERDIKTTGASKIFEDNKWLVVHPTTQEAACYYGKNTQWCTAADDADNQFDTYNKQGPLFVLIDKTANRKYQVHFQTGQLMDENDKPVNYLEFFKNNPQLKKALGEKNYVIGIIAQGQHAFSEALRTEPGIQNYITLDLLKELLNSNKKSNDKVWVAYMFDSLPLELEKKVLESSADNLIFLKNPSDAAKGIAVAKSGEAIRHIANPSEDLQIAAIKHWAANINYIKNPTLNAIAHALYYDPTTIRYVEKNGWKIPDAFYYNALKRSINALAQIKNPSEEMQVFAVQHYNPEWKNGSLAGRLPGSDLKNALTSSKAQWMLIDKLKHYALPYIKHPSAEMMRYAIEISPLSIIKVTDYFRILNSLVPDSLVDFALSKVKNYNDFWYIAQGIDNYSDNMQAKIRKIGDNYKKEHEDYPY